MVKSLHSICKTVSSPIELFLCRDSHNLLCKIKRLQEPHKESGFCLNPILSPMLPYHMEQSQ